jgi:glycosyltransferase involved in cell wall biosynthesis
MVSVVIPTYEMGGKGVEMLNDLLNSLWGQSYRNFEVIVSDDSMDSKISDYLIPLKSVKYYRNPSSPGACSNLNNAIYHAKGSIIKPMFQDDQFSDPDCLQKFSIKFASPMVYWCVCTSAHTSDRGDHVPYYSRDTYELARGCNTFGSPSAVAWKRNDLTFDENLKWLFDVDFYARMVQQFGQPEILDTKVLIREWDGMATRTIADGGTRVSELSYIENKFSNLRP